MGFFSKQEKEDFLTQQAREEGRINNFEESSQAEIRGCTDTINQKTTNNDNSLKTQQTVAPYPPPDMFTTGLTSSVKLLANYVNKQRLGDDFDKDEFDLSSSDTNDSDRPPEWRCKPTYLRQKDFGPQDITRVGVGIAIILLGISAVFNAEIPGVVGLLILIAILSEKLKKH